MLAATSNTTINSAPFSTTLYTPAARGPSSVPTISVVQLLLTIHTPLINIIGNAARIHARVAYFGLAERTTTGSARLNSTAPTVNAIATLTTFALRAVIVVRWPARTSAPMPARVRTGLIRYSGELSCHDTADGLHCPLSQKS